MLAVLASRTYRHLFLAQVIALVGTGLLTVALGLLAFELAGADAGIVLSTALAIKMVAYVGIAFIVGAFANQLPRRAFLVVMDLVRAAVALLLPFITGVWQIYVLIFPAAIGLGGLYANLPSYHSGCPTEREGIRPSAFTLPLGLRSRKPAQPGARGGASDGRQLSLAVWWHSDRLPVLRRPCVVCDSAAAGL